jgi:predicted phosphodiesterase
MPQQDRDQIQIFAASDLHLEFAHLEPKLDRRPDLVLLAGDIGRGADAAQWAAYYFPGTPVVYILGNHEAYRDLLELTLADCRAAAARAGHLHFLENDCVILPLRGRSVRILGATLWTDFRLHGADRREAAMLIAQRCLADFKLIEYRGTRLLPSDTAAFHEESVAWLDRTLSEPHGGPTIVMTHHAPSPRSIPPFYRDSLLSPAFNSDLEWLIRKHQPALWVHGHTHWSVDYRIEATRVFSNQRGYPGEDAGFVMRCIQI